MAGMLVCAAYGSWLRPADGRGPHSKKWAPRTYGWHERAAFIETAAIAGGSILRWGINAVQLPFNGFVRNADAVVDGARSYIDAFQRAAGRFAGGVVHIHDDDMLHNAQTALYQLKGGQLLC